MPTFRPTRRRVLTIAAAAVVLPALGCRGRTGADQNLRATISAALSRAGHIFQANVVGSDDSTLTSIPAPTLTRWRIIEVREDRGPHPVLFHVGTAGRQALLLTGHPAAFERMVKADDGTVTNEEQAAKLGRLQVETTRPGGVLTYVISSVDDIEFRPGIEGADARYRDRITERYRPLVAAPSARRRGNDFEVEVWVMRDSSLQRRDLTIDAAQSISRQVETVAGDLPTPYVR